MASGIYAITSTTGSKYVAHAVDFVGQWRIDKQQLRAGLHPSRPPQLAANKYGVESLSFEVLELCSVALLLEAERRVIARLRPRYNDRQKP